MKIAFTIPTGRPKVKEVVKSFINNAIKFGYDPKCFSIYLSIDTKYKNTSVNDFKLDKNFENLVNKVTYISKEDSYLISDYLKNKLKISSKIIENLFCGQGYSKQRNLALLFALKDGNDYMISVDDDEAPILPFSENNLDLIWKELDFFGPHIKAMENGVDVTSGKVLGYLSPIPSDIESNIPLELRERLGEILSLGNEVINSDSFINLMNKIKYLEISDFDSLLNFDSSLSKLNDVDLFCGGNMGINLKSVICGKIPIFFTPPGARGEDAIFSLQLNNIVAKEVDSYIFHDPFEMYPKIFEGKYPKVFDNIPLNSSTSSRFSSAVIGWLKYAPILLKLSVSSQEVENRLNLMLKDIDEVTHSLGEILDCNLIQESYSTLKEYMESLDFDYMNLVESQKLWKNDLIPAIKNN